MSGINALSGLNKINVDFRPTVDLTAPKNVNDVVPPLEGQNDINVNNIVNVRDEIDQLSVGNK